MSLIVKQTALARSLIRPFGTRRSDKAFCTPETIAIGVENGLSPKPARNQKPIDLPCNHQAVDGVSCEGLRCPRRRQIETAVEKIKATSSGKSFIAQEFICGEPVSVSLICTKDKSSLISLNKQIVIFPQPDRASKL